MNGKGRSAIGRDVRQGGAVGSGSADRRPKPYARDGRFEQKGRELLGKSRKAKVWKVRDTDANPYVPGRTVAVKVLNPGATPDERARLCREGGEDLRLDHPNVVRILDLRGDPPFLVMEYVPGENLRRLSERNGRWVKPDRLVDIAVQLCAAMECLHAAGLIHRDIKPANLMIAGDIFGAGPIRLKLIDLGIAVAADSSEYEVAGTAPYMAPEVELRERATEASDIYGAGAVLYEITTGKKVPSVSAQEWSARRRATPLPPPRRINGDVPGWLSAEIMRAIEVDPGGRFQDAGQMRERLERGVATEAEASTTVIDVDEDAPTRVVGRPRSRPLAFKFLDKLPPFLRERLPAGYEDEEPDHWYLFLLALSAGLVLIALVFLPIEIRVVVFLCELPFWLLTAGVLLGGGSAWLLHEESRRQATLRASRAAGATLGRGLAGAAGVLRLALQAGGRGIAAAALAVSRRVGGLSDMGSAPRSPGAGEERDHEERVRPGCDSRHRRFEHGGRRRGRGNAGDRTVSPFLHRIRTQMAEVGSAARAWAPRLAHQAFMVLLVALVVCIAEWLHPALQSRVAEEPADHRTVLTVIPATVWILLASIGLRRFRVSRASPRRLVAGGLVFLALLAAVAMATPSFASWLELRFWPTQVEGAGTPKVGQTTAPPVASSHPKGPVTAARVQSRKLMARVRRIESNWISLLRRLAAEHWTIDPGTAAAVRGGASAVVSRLDRWQSLSRYEGARRSARHWSKSMKAAAAQLKTGSCHGFTVGERGASARC